MVGAYILVVIGAVVWVALLPFIKRIPEGTVRAVTVFGGAFLLAVCFLGLLPELAVNECPAPTLPPLAPYFAVLAGFLLQQLLDALSAHAEHGHTEHHFTLSGLMLGLSIHAFLEGMPLVAPGGSVNHGLLYGIAIHNIPVALILVGLAAGRGYGFWRLLFLLLLFGLMSPLGSLANLYILRPDCQWQRVLVGMVVGVLLHVSSSILFDHKRNHFSWLNLALMLLAFATAYLTVH